MKRQWVFAVLVIALGCGHRQPPELVYGDAQRLQHQAELDAALKRATAGLREAPSEAWRWRFRLLTADILLDRGETSRALAAVEEPSGPRDPELRAVWNMEIGNARYWLSDLQQAARHLDAAWQAASTTGNNGLKADVELSRAVVQDTYAGMERCYRDALQYASRAGDPYLLARAYAGLGYTRLTYTRYDEALPWLKAAEKTAIESGARRVLANTLGNQGRCYAGLGDFEKALDLIGRASSLAEEIGDRRKQQIFLGNLGDIYQRLGNLDRAIACLERSRDLAEQRGDRTWQGTVFNRLGDLYLSTGDLFSARQFADRAIRIRADLQKKSLVNSQVLAARVAAAERPFAEAESLFQHVIQEARRPDEAQVLWEAHAGLASLYRRNGRRPEADTEYRKAIEVIETQRSSLSRDDYKVTFLAKLIRVYQDYLDFLVDEDRSGEALRLAESARARVLQENLGLGHGKTHVGVAEIQRRLRGTPIVLLAYWLAPRRSFLWAISQDSFAQFQLPRDSEIRRMVEEYNSAILRRRDPLDREYRSATELYQTLLKPVQGIAAAGSRVIVLPDGALNDLNFETLVVPGDPPHYWLEDVTVSVAPSLDVLRFEPAVAASGRNLLFIGDPVPPGSEYAPLPHLKHELEVVERAFPAARRVVYSGRDASPDAYRDAHPQRFYAIHFAAHATSNRESPLNSAVVLSPGSEGYKLYAKDVLAQPIQAGLVTISACRSAGPKAYSGEGLMGFTWAFLLAGARHVVAGLWDVDDDATSRMMGTYYEAIAAGSSPAAALRAAKLRLLHSGTLYRKPYFWGPFEVFTRLAATGKGARF